MAYEVVKVVGGRAYRYRVESYRDGESRKARARWTYLGRVEPPLVLAGALAAVRPRRSPARTREALVEAFGRVADGRPYAEITAGAVAEEAGLAHGTFYRHFKDKRAILLAAVDRLRAEIDRTRPSFDPPYGSRDDERRRVRAWTRAFASPPESRGLIRAWLDALDDDPRLAERRQTRLRERIAALENYLVGLMAASTIELERPAALATALTFVVDAAVRSVAIADAPFDASALDGVSDIFDRAIFTTSSPVISATETPVAGTSPKYPI